MLICEKCFKDESIRNDIINNSVVEGICEACGEYGKLADLNIVRDFFDEFLQLLEFDSNSDDTIVSLIQKEWSIFSDETIAIAILTDVLSSNGCPLQLTDRVSYNATIREGSLIWEKLKKEIKEKSRFFSNSDDLNEDYVFFDRLILRNGQRLYRARITPADRKKLKPSEMGCPQIGLSKGGRANPLGISYLYLSKDIDTTYYEVRATFLDNVSVGKFIIKNDLNIVDFDSDSSIYSLYNDGIYTLSDIILSKKLMRAISSDLSKPLRRYDTELEYIPTQWICEFCKVKLGADGVCFKSSLQEGGKNYVLFDSDKAKCVSVQSHVIRRVNIGRS